MQACFDEPLVVVVLADYADLVGDEVCAVEADAEPDPDGRQGELYDPHGQGANTNAGSSKALKRWRDRAFNDRRILLRPERLSMNTVASQKLANHGDVAAGRHGLHWSF